MIGQLSEMWIGRSTEFGACPDGSSGPLGGTRVQVVVTPGQWEALARIGGPGGIAHGVQEALAAGIADLDRQPLRPRPG
ncbi:hypothetical protein [Kitasatospora sp. NPDC059327]|uniref:hypothetical protein n=1 Tax=Kitasatospora sp. NPDC059327 TaxID=3346803 RepID=UPI0036925FE8